MQIATPDAHMQAFIADNEIECDGGVSDGGRGGGGGSRGRRGGEAKAGAMLPTESGLCESVDAAEPTSIY